MNEQQIKVGDKFVFRIIAIEKGLVYFAQIRGKTVFILPEEKFSKKWDKTANERSRS